MSDPGSNRLNVWSGGKTIALLGGWQRRSGPKATASRPTPFRRDWQRDQSCSEPGRGGAAAATRRGTVPIAEAVAALLGVWTECDSGSDSPVRSIDINAPGIEFTSDGHFQLLAYSPPIGGQVWDGTVIPSTAPADTGTYDVVEPATDAGPTNLPSYELDLHLSDGSVHPWPFSVYAEPNANIVFADPGVRSFEYAHPAKRTYDTGLCGAPFGSIDTPDDGQAALARMVGRWVACPTVFPFSTSIAENFEIDADGTWYPLMADETGNLVRIDGPSIATADGGYQTFVGGTVEVVSSSPPTLRFDTGDSLSGSYTVAQPILGACGTLAFAASDGNPPVGSVLASTLRSRSSPEDDALFRFAHGGPVAPTDVPRSR
jgi:hypothetical protein